MIFQFPDSIPVNFDFSKYFTIPAATEEENPTADLINQEVVKTLNIKRQQMCDALALQATSPSTIEVIEAYLKNLLVLCEAEPKASSSLISKSPEKFKWKAVLSKGIRLSLSKNIVDRPKISSTSLWFEATNSLLAVGLTMANIASKLALQRETLQESGRSQCIDMLCRASGVFRYISQQFLPRWQGKDEARPEFSSEILMAVSEVLLADANRLVIEQAQLRGLSSGSVLKIEVAVYGKYSEASRILQRLSKGIQEEFSESLYAYIIDGCKLMESLIFNRFSRMLHETGDDGFSVACITFAYNNLVTLLKSDWEPHRRYAENLIGEYESFRSQVVRINNNVTFQRVPSIEEARARLPSGCLMANIKPYSPPGLPRSGSAEIQ